MGETTYARCPHCGAENDFGGVLRNVTVTGGMGLNIAVQCAACDKIFDATGGQDGTFDTGPDGRLSLRTAVFEARAAIISGQTALADVEDFIRRLETDEPEAPQDPRLARVWQWLHTHPIAKQYTAPVLVGIFVLLLTLLTDDDAPAEPTSPAPVTVTVDVPDDPDLKQLVTELEQLRHELEEEHQRRDGGPAMSARPPQ